MSKVEELLKDNKLAEKLSMAKLNDLLKKEEEDKKPSKAVIIFAIIGVLVAVAAAAYGIYRFFTPDYLDDFDDEDPWVTENIAKAMEDKKISFDGAFDDLDYKALVKDEIDFAILPSEFLPGNAKDEEDADAADETADTKAEDQKDDKDDKTTDEKADEGKTPEELLKEENERRASGNPDHSDAG